MGNAESKSEVCENTEYQEAELERLIKEKGVAGAQTLIREKLDNRREVEIKIGVTGTAGVGKSSFINRFRGIDDEDDLAAKPSVCEGNLKPIAYNYLPDHPENSDHPNIILVDLPGIGTPTYPYLKNYCEEVDLDTYDTFLILTCTRFAQLELELALKIESMGKSFFLVRTKLDQDEDNENRKRKPNIEKMLRKIRSNLHKKMECLGILEDKIFLISNRHNDKWDFLKLVEAIVEKMPNETKRDALLFNLSVKNLSEKIVRQKVKVFKSQAKWVVVLFIPAGLLDLASGNFVSHLINWAEVKRRTENYRCQLGLPEEGSDAYNMLSRELQNEMKEFYPKTDSTFWSKYFGCLLKVPVAFTIIKALETKKSLHRLLGDMESVAIKILNQAEDMDE